LSEKRERKEEKEENKQRKLHYNLSSAGILHSYLLDIWYMDKLKRRCRGNL
jgi:hypothetical protein